MAKIETLDDLSKEMSSNSKKDMVIQTEQLESLDNLTSTLNRFIEFTKRASADAKARQLEADREANKSKTKTAATTSATPQSNSSLSLGNLLTLPALSSMILPLTAGLTALAAGFVGLRGWEKSGLKALDSFTDFSKSLDQKFVNLRAQLMRKIGLDPRLGSPDIEGNRKLQVPIMTQVREALESRFSSVLESVKQRYYSAVGLGIDGKPVAIQGADGRFMKNPVSGFDKFTTAIGNILKPFAAAGSAATDYIGGKGANLFATISKFAGSATAGVTATASKFLGLFGKILWPIGVLMSAFQGWTDWNDKDKETVFGEAADGITTALSNFIGAPFDLIKKGIIFIIEKLFGTAEYDPLTGDPANTYSTILQAAKDFSFEGFLKKIFFAPFGVIESAYLFIKDAFTNPDGLSGAWKNWKMETFGLTEDQGLIKYIILDPMKKALNLVIDKLTAKTEDIGKFVLGEEKFDKVKKFFEEDIPNKLSTYQTKIQDFRISVLAKSFDVETAFGDAKQFFTITLPGKISDYAIKAKNFTDTITKRLTDKVATGFDNTKEFFATTLPGKIKEYSSKISDFTATFTEDLSNRITAGFDNTKEFFAITLPSKLKEYGDKAQEVKNDLINRIVEATEEGKTFVKSIPGRIGTKMEQLADTILSFIPSIEQVKKFLIEKFGGTAVGKKMLSVLGLQSPQMIQDAGIQLDNAREGSFRATNLPEVLSFEQNLINRSAAMMTAINDEKLKNIAGDVLIKLSRAANAGVLGSRNQIQIGSNLTSTELETISRSVMDAVRSVEQIDAAIELQNAATAAARGAVGLGGQGGTTVNQSSVVIGSDGRLKAKDEPLFNYPGIYVGN